MPVTIFDSVARQMPDVLFSDGVADPKKTAAFLSFNAKDIATAIGVPSKNVRPGARLSGEARQRLAEIANTCALVFDHFDGDLDKTHLWFTTRNPLLGNIAPREMIRYGLYRKVLRFIHEARAQEPTLAA